MHTALLFTLAVGSVALIGGGIAIFFGVRSAPLAVEDDNGFHVIRERSNRAALASGAMPMES